MLPINPILAAASANFLLGMALYSDKVFGASWTKMTGMKCGNLKDMPMRVAAEIVASILISSALYIAILTFKKTELVTSQEMFTKIYAWFFKDLSMVQADIMSSMKIAGFLWLGLVVPFVLSKTVWEVSVDWKHFFVQCAFTLAQFLAMAGALAYFG